MARFGTISIAEMVKGGSAIEMTNMFTFDGSLSKGRHMTRDLAKLMLRAYNAEAENVVRTLRAGNVGAAVRQVTDRYLLGLARRHGGRVVTFDRAPAAVGGDGVIGLLPEAG